MDSILQAFFKPANSSQIVSLVWRSLDIRFRTPYGKSPTDKVAKFHHLLIYSTPWNYILQALLKSGF